MKSISKYLILTSLLSSSAHLYACAEQEGSKYTRASNIGALYVGANIGNSNPTDKWSKGAEYDNKAESSLTYGAIGGYKFTSNYSVEASFQNRNNFRYISKVNGDTQNLSSKSVMVSGVMSFPQGIFEPYILVGGGVALHNVGDFTSTELGVFKGRCISSFAWQAGVGSRISLTNNMSFDITYKYVDLGIFMTKSAESPSLTALNAVHKPYEGKTAQHEVHIGIIYKF